MLDVVFRRDSRHRLSSVFSSGHVEIAESSPDEYSLVCAAASAILQAARLGLQGYLKLPLDVTQQPGEQSLRWPEQSRGDERVAAITETARLSLEQIARQYPQHVRVRTEAEP